MNIRIAGLAKQSIVDGPGLRLVVFAQGCPHRCPGCHNPETHDFDAGQEMPASDILAELDANPLLAGITLSGGEPLCQAGALLPLAAAVKERGKGVACFTGYTLEELLDMRKDDAQLAALLELIDLLIDGRYDHTQRDLTLRFRGSRNQRMLDLPASLAACKPILVE